MNFKNFGLLAFLLIGVLGCNTQQQKAEREAEDAYNEQAQIDEQIISAYLKENNISAERTSSGIYYNTIEAGAGLPAQTDDSVQVHYTGNIMYGKVFDSSHFRNSSLGIRIGETSLITGWTELLALMQAGERTIFYIPSGLAYGGSGNVQTISINGTSQSVQSIPPNAVLIFDVEMLEILR